MVLVSGAYCPSPKHVCKRWLDPPSSPYAFYRCAEYEEPATCASPEREEKRFCIDREEYVAPGAALPLVNQSWTSATRVCASLGKRLCLESEWNFACEGEEMRPYPYGFVRDASLCNIDRNHLGKLQEGLADLRAPIDAYPDCLSPFGVHDMSGNVEEWATLDSTARPRRGRSVVYARGQCAGTQRDEGRMVAPGEEHLPRGDRRTRGDLRRTAGGRAVLPRRRAVRARGARPPFDRGHSSPKTSPSG